MSYLAILPRLPAAQQSGGSPSEPTKVLSVTSLPLSDETLSTQTPESGMVLPDHWVSWASKNSSSAVPVNTLSVM